MEQRSSRIEILRNNEETVKNFKWASEQNDVPSKLTLNKLKTQWGGSEYYQRTCGPSLNINSITVKPTAPQTLKADPPHCAIAVTEYDGMCLKFCALEWHETWPHSNSMSSNQLGFERHHVVLGFRHEINIGLLGTSRVPQTSTPICSSLLQNQCKNLLSARKHSNL